MTGLVFFIQGLLFLVGTSFGHFKSPCGWEIWSYSVLRLIRMRSLWCAYKLLVVSTQRLLI